MGNLFDYLKSRGDLSLEEAPFNDVDSLILARLSNLPFDGIVPGNLDSIISVGAASERFFQSGEAEKKVILRADLRLLREVAVNKRFAQMGLCGYTNQIDIKVEKQFAAMIIRIGPQLSFISFGGTDLSLTGWKEDFNMSFCTPIPAQEEAVCYLNQAATSMPGKFIVGGHSKGGNLSAYSSSFCETQVQERIIAVYNMDGPGFNASILESNGHRRIAEKIKTFIPHSSVVGMLLQHEEDYYVVRSTQIGLMQHDLFSWEVENDHFVYVDQVTHGSKFIDRTLKTWLSSLSLAEREEFVDGLFSILEETNATTVRELSSNWHKNARVVLKSIRNLDDDMRQNLAQTLGLLGKAAKQAVQLTMPRLLPREQRQDQKP